MTKRIILIAAIAEGTRALGKDNDLIFQIKPDLARFKALTLNCSIIMGRRTWESLPFKPLPKRQNIVVSSNAQYDAPGATVVTSLEAAIAAAETEDVYVIGGSQLYAAALERADRLELTVVHSDEDGDVHFPAYEHLFTKVVHEDRFDDHDPAYTFLTLER